MLTILALLPTKNHASGTYLEKRVAVAWAVMVQNVIIYNKANSSSMLDLEGFLHLGNISGYRSYADQVQATIDYSGGAATPGTSNHGYGTAIDFSLRNTNYINEFNWLEQNGINYGYPDWLKSRNESWHWNYVPAHGL